MITHVARDGTVLGTFSEPELTAAIAAGTVQPTDFFWQEGMSEWASIATLLPQAPESPPQPGPVAPVRDANAATEKQLDYIYRLSGKQFASLTKEQAGAMINEWQAAGKAFNGPTPESWETEPASAAQVEYIRTLGGNPDPAISKAQASRLIDALKVQQREREEEAARMNAEAAERLAAAFPSHYLFLRVKAAEKQLAETLAESAEKISKCSAAVQDAEQEVPLIRRKIADMQSELHRARASLESAKTDEEREEVLGDIEDIEFNISEAKRALQEDLRDAKTDLQEAKKAAVESERDEKEEVAFAKRDRVNWWLIALGRSPHKDDWFEIGPASLLDLAPEYFENFGRVFKRPSAKQVSAVLDALDCDLPGWDKGNAENFFAVLWNNFPELHRSGCSPR